MSTFLHHGSPLRNLDASRASVASRSDNHRRAFAPLITFALSLATLTACQPIPAAAPEGAPAPHAAPATPPPAPPREASASPEPSRYDVIIVGAGMAGITAAKALREAHLRVVVLEATGRIGGRGITTETLGNNYFSAPIDLGGAWIHGVKTNPLTPIIKGSAWKTEVTHVEASEHFFFKGRFADDKDRRAFKDAYDSFEKDLADVFKERGDEATGKDSKRPMSADDVLQANSKFKKLDKALQRLIALNAGPLESAVDLAQSSIEDSTDFISDDDDFLHRGFGTFVEAYGKDIEPLVRLQTPVDHIVRKDGGVVVSSGTQTFEARKVLVTVSTGVLGSGKIKFEPGLPASKLKAIDSLPMGVLDKVILEFNTADVFPTDGKKTLENTWVLYGGSDEAGKDDLAFVFQPMKTNIAVGFFGGARAKELESQQDKGAAEMIRIAMKAMTEMCKASKPKADAGKCDLERAKKKATTTAWFRTDWTIGAYSAAMPGQSKMREVLAEPIESTIYFAGEACYNASYNGSFAAAYASALRSSHALIDCIEREDSKPKRACEWEKLESGER